MSAFMHTPGPQELYVQFAQGSAGRLFVGTCVTAPEPEINPNFIEAFNDYGGRSVAFDTVWDGATALVPITVNRMDLDVCRAMVNQPLHTADVAVLGSETFLARGSLVIARQDFTFWIKNTFFGTANATPGLGPGRMYLSASVVGYKESTVGTRVEEVAFILKCQNVFFGPLANPMFGLYSESPANFQALLPN